MKTLLGIIIVVITLLICYGIGWFVQVKLNHYEPEYEFGDRIVYTAIGILVVCITIVLFAIGHSIGKLL